MAGGYPEVLETFWTLEPSPEHLYAWGKWKIRKRRNGKGGHWEGDNVEGQAMNHRLTGSYPCVPSSFLVTSVLPGLVKPQRLPANSHLDTWTLGTRDTWTQEVGPSPSRQSRAALPGATEGRLTVQPSPTQLTGSGNSHFPGRTLCSSRRKTAFPCSTELLH